MLVIIAIQNCAPQQIYTHFATKFSRMKKKAETGNRTHQNRIKYERNTMFIRLI